MIRNRQSFRALIDSIESLGRAKEPTTALLHGACSNFAATLSELTGQQCEIRIGTTPIARCSEHRPTTARTRAYF